MEREEDVYGTDLSREEVDLLRRIGDNGSGGLDGPTLQRLERLGYLTMADPAGGRRLSAKGELTRALVR